MIRSIVIATLVATAQAALPAHAAGDPGATHHQAVQFAKGKGSAQAPGSIKGGCDAEWLPALYVVVGLGLMRGIGQTHAQSDR